MQKKNKKLYRLLTVLLSAALMLAMVPAAFAAQCYHTGNNWTYESNGDGTHKVICNDCGETVLETALCVYHDGVCLSCGAEKPECHHTGNNWSYVDNGNGTHQVVCADCGTVVIPYAVCVYQDGACALCGAAAPECFHTGNNFSYVSNGNGTHQIICNDCGEVVIPYALCIYDRDGVCMICGTEVVHCDHMANDWTYVNNGNGTHMVICNECGQVVALDAECVYTDGVCLACGSHEDAVPAAPVLPAIPARVKAFFDSLREFFLSRFNH